MAPGTDTGSQSIDEQANDAVLVQAKLTSFSAAARLQLRTCLADHANLPIMQVSIEGMKAGQSTGHTQARVQPSHSIAEDDSQSSAPQQSTNNAVSNKTQHDQPATIQEAAGNRGVTVAVHIQLGVEQQNGKELIAALQSQPDLVISNCELLAAMGSPDAASLYAAMVDVTPGCRESQSEAAKPFAALTCKADAAPNLSQDIVAVRC